MRRVATLIALALVGLTGACTGGESPAPTTVTETAQPGQLTHDPIYDSWHSKSQSYQDSMCDLYTDHPDTTAFAMVSEASSFSDFEIDDVDSFLAGECS